MHEPQEPAEHEGGTRAGHVALVGRPNVGKSSLLNALIGQKLSIVTARAQTTRTAVSGILTREREQIVFIDTPGLLDPSYALHRSMQHAAMRALDDADVLVLLLDATRPSEVPRGVALESLETRASRAVVAINKTDAAGSDGVKALASWAERVLDLESRFISALTGGGLEGLVADIVAKLPPGPFYYPTEDVAIQPVRFFVGELVRETIFEEYEQEVPYASEVRVEEYRESQDPIYIRATIYVERESQKPILLGRGGERIRGLGERSRAKIEALVGQDVYLDLWVKALPGWRRRASMLRYLGYTVPAEGGGGENETAGS